MCITKVEAWSFDGKTYPTEGRAIHAAVTKLIDNAGVAQKVIDCSSDLIPLLQRVVEIEAEKHQPARAAATTDRDPATGLLPGQTIGAL